MRTFFFSVIIICIALKSPLYTPMPLNITAVERDKEKYFFRSPEIKSFCGGVFDIGLPNGGRGFGRNSEVIFETFLFRQNKVANSWSICVIATTQKFMKAVVIKSNIMQASISRNVSSKIISKKKKIYFFFRCFEIYNWLFYWEMNNYGLSRLCSFSDAFWI